MDPCQITHYDAGTGAVNYIIDHAEADFVFIQDRKVKEVRTANLLFVDDKVLLLLFVYKKY